MRRTIALILISFFALPSPVRSDPARPTARPQSWAFKPPVVPEVPGTRDTTWCSTPIDRFVLVALEAKGLRPAPPADKRTWIRRVTFDLIGLPPSPREVEAFLADESPLAFAAVVDRLLASPHYGERWGRHWLDVARYADSNGLDENVAHANAWRYRDYVIDAFNRDKPYDRFVIEQLAGDLLTSFADDARRREALVATGFLSLGPKVLAEVDERKMEMDIIDEQINTVGRTFMGLELGCARCHDHKFDPIRQDDYYALAGIFKSTRTMDSFKLIAKWHENTIATEADEHRRQAHLAKIAAAEDEVKKLVEGANRALCVEVRRRTAIFHLAVPFALRDVIGAAYPADTVASLQRLQGEVSRLKKAMPVLPTAMGVRDGKVVDARVHKRGSHLNLGQTVHRRLPEFLAGTDQNALGAEESGRRRLAGWLAGEDHPLTARVMVNRLWRWHFGVGLVPTPDNFGTRGEKPSNPLLLDWLAHYFVDCRWSIKALHRLILLSSTYRASSAYDAVAARLDPENRLIWRMPLRRLEAETIRDTLLAVSGSLDRTMGGSMLNVKNREFIFNHTSKDKTRYESRRRSIYLPVIRNHLYDVLELFDYPDPAVPDGDRSTTTVPSQALFLLNSEFILHVTREMAIALLRNPDRRARVTRLYVSTLGRPPTAGEMATALAFVDRAVETLTASTAQSDARRLEAWRALCHVIVASNEFFYLR